MMTGYLALLLLSAGVSVYAILQLRHVHDIANSMILVDNSLLDLHKGLTDALLSEQRYEKKYVLMRDRSLFRRFSESAADFEEHLHEAGRKADSRGLGSVLARAGDLHRAYKDLVFAEAGMIRSGSAYSAAWYRAEKESVLESLGDELQQLRALSQKNMVDKVRHLRETGARATGAGMMTTAAAVGTGLVLSVLITGSITRPLNDMKIKMAEVSGGIRDVDLEISSPPEIAALARSFTVMCGKLRELDTLKTDFYALMSHELRTPLTSIRESTNLFLEGRAGSVTEKQKKLLTIMAEESDRMIDLVSSLLDISRLESGMVAYHFSRREVNPLILRAVNEVLPLAEAKGIRIETKLEDLPLLDLDAERILQVLRNLIGNALKFTPREGRVTVSSRFLGQQAAVSVADTGPGIPGDQAAVIFEKYRQAAVEGRQKLQGSGLGLAIVRHIVHDHGGTVWVESDGKQGSTFIFVLPLCS